MFTWIPIHREAIHRILEYRDRQHELLEVLSQMEQQGLKVIGLNDQGIDGQRMPLAAIDPFTFFATFNRAINDANRKTNWTFLKTRWQLSAEVPEDFAGIPVMNPMKSWFLPYARDREADHVPSLWKLATQAVDGDLSVVDSVLFDRCLELSQVGIGNLTMGLFWINPERFLPADKKTQAYVESNGIKARVKDHLSYGRWIAEAADLLGTNYALISHDAHVFATTPSPVTPNGASAITEWRFTNWMGPVLDALRSLGGSGKPAEVRLKIQELLQLPEGTKGEKLESGQSRFYNEVAWARQYLFWEGLLESPKHGVWALTARGRGRKLDGDQAQRIAEKWVHRHKEKGLVRPEEGAEDAGETPGGGKIRGGEGLDSIPNRRYWTLSAGNAGDRWRDFQDHGIAAIHFGIANLRQFKSKGEVRKRFLGSAPDDDSSRKNDVLACWQFAWEMSIGDIVFVKGGRTKLLGCGVVEGDYTFQPDRVHGQHVRQVKWIRSGEWDMPDDEMMAAKTLTEITGYPEFLRRIANAVGLVPPPGTELVGALPRPIGIAHWWLNAKPAIWDFKDMRVGQRMTYTSHSEKGNKRQKYRNFQEIKPGDLILGYVTSPQREVVAVCRITKALHKSDESERIEFEMLEQLEQPIPYADLEASPDLAKAEPLVNHQGSLFRLSSEEFEVIRAIIDEAQPQRSAQPEPFSKKQAMAGLFLAEAQFDEMLNALREKKNVVLQGAPGVGKTFVAKRLAYALLGAKDPQRVEMIQFHQSYSYEDFIQGYRPTSKGHFELKYGIFYQFCRRAQRDQERPYVFIIDEVNRGNLSKIFGELMMLIEPDKRGREHGIPLAYAQDVEDRFYIPENLHLIGMMNTADRSLAMVDYALRRRFRFINLRPEFASVSFRDSLAQCGVPADLIKRIVARMGDLNEVIAADAKNLGPGYQIGHSYFCPRNGITADENWYRRVIESEIGPLIQEYWFDNDQKVSDLKAALLE